MTNAQIQQPASAAVMLICSNWVKTSSSIRLLDISEGQDVEKCLKRMFHITVNIVINRYFVQSNSLLLDAAIHQKKLSV